MMTSARRWTSTSTAQCHVPVWRLARSVSGVSNARVARSLWTVTQKTGTMCSNRKESPVTARHPSVRWVICLFKCFLLPVLCFKYCLFFFPGRRSGLVRVLFQMLRTPNCRRKRWSGCTKLDQKQFAWHPMSGLYRCQVALIENGVCW